MAIIVPAILEKTKEGFLEKLSIVLKLPGAERMQVDFGDGQMIDKLLPPSEIEPLNPAYFWEAHLMIEEPTDFLDYKLAGFNLIILHYEAYKDINDLKIAIVEVKKTGLKAGLAINPETPIEVLGNFKDLDLYLIMSVVPGKQGQAFLPQSLERIKSLKELIPNAIIETDGGTNENNVSEIAKAGADFIVAGSAVVKAVNPAEAYEKLKIKVQNG